MTVSGKNGTVHGGPFDTVPDGGFWVVSEELLDELVIAPAIVAETLTPVMIGVTRDGPEFLPHALDASCFVGILKNSSLLGLSDRFHSHSVKAQTEFPLHLISKVGGNDVGQTLNEVRHLGLGGEVEDAEGQRVVDAEASNRFNHSGFTATVVRQFRDLSDVTAVADFDHVERDDVTVGRATRTSREVQEVRGMQTEFAEVALEHVDRGDVRRSGRITVEGANGGLGVGATSRRSREDEVREGSLEGGADESVVVLELTGLVVDAGQDALNDGLGKGGRADRGAISRRGAESIRNSEGRILGGDGLEPLVEATGQIRVSTVVQLGTVVRAKRRFHVTLEALNTLGDVVSEFRLNASDGSDGLRERRHTHGTAENLDVIAQFSTVHGGTVLDVVLVGRDVGTIDDARGLGSREGIDLPAELGVAGLRALLRHGGEGGVLSVDKCDEVSEFFPLAAGEPGFSK